MELELERRRALGLDHFDEMWDGVYWVAPHAHSDLGLLEEEIAALLRPWAQRAGLRGSAGFNLGAPNNYRVPDRGLPPDASRQRLRRDRTCCRGDREPGDETFAKLPCYGAQGVVEVIVVLGVDLQKLIRDVDWPGNDESGAPAPS